MGFAKSLFRLVPPLCSKSRKSKPEFNFFLSKISTIFLSWPVSTWDGTNLENICKLVKIKLFLYSLCKSSLRYINITVDNSCVSYMLRRLVEVFYKLLESFRIGPSCVRACHFTPNLRHLHNNAIIIYASFTREICPHYHIHLPWTSFFARVS